MFTTPATILAAAIRGYVTQLGDHATVAAELLAAGNRDGARAETGTIEQSIEALIAELVPMVGDAGATMHFDEHLFPALAALVPGFDAVVDALDGNAIVSAA